MSKPELSLVLSLRNEEAVLPELVRRLQTVLTALSIRYELIFINDASTDRSSALLEDYARAFSEVKVLQLSRRFGIQASIVAGIQHAGGDAVLTMDADLQDPPELIPEMVKKWREGADVVHMVRSEREGESWIKKALTQAAYRCIHSLSEIPFPIEAGDFKLLSRRTVTELLKHEEQMPYLRGLIASLGFHQVSIPYRREKRYAGASHFSLLGRGPLETFMTGVISFSPMPLFAIFMSGLVLLFCSFIGFAGVSFLVFWNAVNFLIWVMSAFFLLLSLNLTGIGLLGLYLWYALKQTQKRPLYIVDRKINF